MHRKLFADIFVIQKRTHKKTTATKKTYQNKKQKIPNNKNKIQKDQNQKSNETTKYWKQKKIKEIKKLISKDMYKII